MSQARSLPKIVFTLLLLSALSLTAAAPRRGKDRLRELAVFPQMSLKVELSFLGKSITGNVETDPPEEISRLKEELKSHGDDHERWIRLAYLLDKAGSAEESKSGYRKAEGILRKRSEQRPQDGLVLIDLAAAVAGLGNREEALHLCRRATEVAPEEAKCWAALGTRLDASFFKWWEPGRMAGQALDSQPSMLKAFMEYRPSPDALEKAEAGIREGGACFDRAVALAPKEADVFLARAGHRSVSLMMEVFSRSFRNSEKLEVKKLMGVFYSSPIVADLEQAAGLAPKNYRLIGAIPWLRYCDAAMRAGGALPKPGHFSDELRQAFRQAITRLEDLGHDPDKKLAAGALETAALLHYMMSDDIAVAKPLLTQAVAADPTRDQAWEMLVVMVGTSEGDFAAEMVSMCETRLKTRDTVRNHLLLTRAYARAKNWEKVAAEARIAAAREPDNLAAHLTLVAAGIRQSTGEESLAPVMRRLERVKALLGKMPAGDERYGRVREFGLNAALVCGLVDDVEQGRSIVQKILNDTPDDEVAREILANLQ